MVYLRKSADLIGFFLFAGAVLSFCNNSWGGQIEPIPQPFCTPKRVVNCERSTYGIKYGDGTRQPSLQDFLSAGTHWNEELKTYKKQKPRLEKLLAFAKKSHSQELGTSSPSARALSNLLQQTHLSSEDSEEYRQICGAGTLSAYDENSNTVTVCPIASVLPSGALLFLVAHESGNAINDCAHPQPAEPELRGPSSVNDIDHPLAAIKECLSQGKPGTLESYSRQPVSRQAGVFAFSESNKKPHGDSAVPRCQSPINPESKALSDWLALQALERYLKENPSATKGALALHSALYCLERPLSSLNRQAFSSIDSSVHWGARLNLLLKKPALAKAASCQSPVDKSCQRSPASQEVNQ
ncbi:MAG: hypothetical protein H6626_00785 [Pseudobdellovibrionaceae bacterium]|nr:hypothetical protein [Bdellovibrionales bacterium]USN47659.1 MAG: hypothetical protein H6626_00785 [Pseudobdellovibrionaceae bacterium]